MTFFTNGKEEFQKAQEEHSMFFKPDDKEEDTLISRLQRVPT